MKPRPLIAITFPNHWSIKNLIHSGVVGRLQSECDIQGWAPAAKIPHLQGLVEAMGLEPIEWVVTPEYREDRQLRKSRHLQKSLLYERHGVSTERILQRSSRGGRSGKQLLASRAVRLIANLPFGERLSRQCAERRWELTDATGVEFPSVPDLLFATNPVDFREDVIVKAAMVRGVPVRTMVPSWDNLTSKGVLFAHYDRVFVWNETMRSEVWALYPEYREDQLPVVGIPRFDTYLNRAASTRGKVLTGLGLDPSRQTILFANTATKSFPDQPAVARHLAEWVQTSEGRDYQLLVRCHPHDCADQYQFLTTFDKVAVWPRGGESSFAFGVDTVPPANDLEVLHDMLSVADVCVNSASTIALDAAACDVPILSVAYDGDRELPYAESVRSFYDYTHQRPFLKANAADFADSREGLIHLVQVAAMDRSRRSLERQNLAQLVIPVSPVNAMVEGLLEGILSDSRTSLRA